MHTLYWYGRTLYSTVYHHPFFKICCVSRAPSLVPRSRACHKHCGLGTRLKPGKQPCDKRSNPPVANWADLDTLCQYG